jgi:hypothetical protein
VNELLTYGVMMNLVIVGVCMVNDNADRITESAKLGTKVFV